jgi:dihydroflavonol-4-reductase
VRCAVTGANGFVGSHVVRRLLERGHSVLALVGPDRDCAGLEGLPVEVREIDLLDPARLRASLAGGEWLVHSAALYAFWHPDPLEIHRVNALGTRAVLEAAAAHGYRKVVYTSSAATLTPALAEDGGGEERVFAALRFEGHYKLSKLVAELVALRFAARGLPLVVVHPTTVIGEGDRRPTPTGSLVVHFLRGRMKLYVDTVLDLVDVEDVAEGHVLALEAGRPGHAYVLGGEALPMREVTRMLAELTGLPAPRLALPLGAMRALAALGEWISGVTGRPPLVDRESWLHARANRAFSSEKARKELGYRPLPARIALARAVRWFADHGYASRRCLRSIERHGELARVLSGAARP